MTQQIQSALARLLAGEAIPPNDPCLRDLLTEMRDTVRNPNEQRELGMVTLTLLNAHLRSVMLTAKAMNTARGAAHD